MKLPALLDSGLQALGLRPKMLTAYDEGLIQKALAGTDYLGRTNATYQVVNSTLSYLNPQQQALREKLVGQVGRVNGFFAKKAADIPWTLWKRGADKKREQLPYDAPLLELLWQPNPMTSWSAFMRQISTLYHADGNVYVWANKLETGPNKGKPSELWILPSALVEPRGGGPMQPVTAYRYTPDPNKPGEYEDLEVEEVLPLKNDPLPGEKKGVSTIQSAYREATVDKSTSDAINSQMQNQGPPGLIAVLPDSNGARVELSVPTIQDVRNRMDRNYSGPNNRGKLPILSADVKYVSTGVTAADLTILELRIANLREMCGWWGFSSVLLGDMEASTDNNYQNARKAMYTDAILPYLGNIVAEFSRWLCPMYEKGMWLEVDISAIQELQVDKLATATWLEKCPFIKVERKAEIMGEAADPNFTGYLIPAGLDLVESVADLAAERQKRGYSEYGLQSE